MPHSTTLLIKAIAILLSPLIVLAGIAYGTVAAVVAVVAVVAR